MPLTTLPPSPVVHELAQRLSTRLHDLKGSYSHILTPPGLPYAAPYDTLLLPGTLSLTNTPAATLQSLLPYLRPEGAVLGWVLGQGSFPELFSACAEAGFPTPPALPSVQDVGGLLQSLGLGLPVVDRDLLTLTAPTPERLIQHLKTHGVLQRPPHAGLVTPRRWALFCDALPRNAHGLPFVTLEVIFFHALTPSHALPKAAKRGSGTVSKITILAPCS